MCLEQQLIQNIKNYKNINDIIIQLKLTPNSGNYKKIREIIFINNLDTSHFVIYDYKYFKIIRNCPKCGTEYETMDSGYKHKQFCSRKCANGKNWSEEHKKKLSDIAKKSEKVQAANKINAANIAENRIKNKKVIDGRKCKECNISYCVLTNKETFCSDECKTKWWSKHHKNLYKTGKNRICGGGKTKWLPYKNIKVQGTYELRTCYILDKMLKNNDIKNWSYTNDRIQYIGLDNKQHTYILDFKIICNDNSYYYIETKGWKKDIDELKWKAVKDQGHELKVWYLKEIENMELIYKNII